MTITYFDPADSLIIVTARLWGSRGDKLVSLAFDTAATHTHLTPDILDDLGYSPRQGDRRTVVHSAIGSEPGYLIRVERFEALGFENTDFQIHAHDLPDGYGLDGLLGLSFLSRFNYEIRSREGRILVEEAAE